MRNVITIDVGSMSPREAEEIINNIRQQQGLMPYKSSFWKDFLGIWGCFWSSIFNF